jgi:23S rRNA-/tRNA-specific pseudouridylate synthase
VPAFRELTATHRASLASLLTARFKDASALADGRVFVDGKRVHADIMLAPGQCVRVGGKVAAAETPIVLFENAELVVIDKASGLSTIPDTRGETASALGALEARYGKLHATSRLDREVSGVVIFARTEQSATRLREARDQGAYKRQYVALSHPATSATLANASLGAQHVWNAPIGRAANPHLRQIQGKDAVPAETHAFAIAQTSAAMLWRMHPETGRTHQLRLHASHAGCPLLGDAAYGGKRSIAGGDGRVLSISRIMLHAARVTIPHGTYEAPVPEAMRRLWSELGGEDSAWQLAFQQD